MYLKYNLEILKKKQSDLQHQNQPKRNSNNNLTKSQTLD